MEQTLQVFLYFIVPWSGYLAFTAASVLILLWLFSNDGDATHEQVASSFLWAFLWPVRWLYVELKGERSGTQEAITRGSQVFKTVRGAKDHLAERIANQARRDGNPLTEVERKMLYFSEGDWTLPDMKSVSSDFDRDYDQGKYEKKIGELIQGIEARLPGESKDEQEKWCLAWKKLSRGDHYLLVLANGANRPSEKLPSRVNKLLIALVLLAYGALDLSIRHWMRNH